MKLWTSHILNSNNRNLNNEIILTNKIIHRSKINIYNNIHAQFRLLVKYSKSNSHSHWLAIPLTT